MAPITVGSIGDITVILVDRDSLFVYFLSEYLNRIPGLIVIGWAKSSEEILYMAKTMHPDAILINLDTETKNRTGAVLKLRNQCPYTALIALTDLEGYFPPSVLDALGMDSIVPKSALTRLLAPVIQSAVQKRPRKAYSLD